MTVERKFEEIGLFFFFSFSFSFSWSSHAGNQYQKISRQFAYDDKSKQILSLW